VWRFDPVSEQARKLLRVSNLPTKRKVAARVAWARASYHHVENHCFISHSSFSPPFRFPRSPPGISPKTLRRLFSSSEFAALRDRAAAPRGRRCKRSKLRVRGFLRVAYPRFS